MCTNKINGIRSVNPRIASIYCSLTLWPAFIGAISALGPDPATMVNDNVWWAILFSLTCSAIPGASSIKPPHHIESTSTSQGRDLCEQWQPVRQAPREVSRSWALAGTPPRQNLVVLEWICFVLCIVLYLAFSVLFAYFLRDCVVMLADTRYWLAVASWYWISPAPALGAILFSEIWQHRFELYEPEERDSTESWTSDSKASGVLSSALLSTTTTSVATAFPTTPERASILAVSYHRVNTPTLLHVWSRVIMHQWHRRYYRLLIKPSSKNPYFLLIRLLVGLGRIGVFALGSTWMGNIILVPIPQDLWLFTLLLITSAIPRLLFPSFWSNGARGADLVVVVRPIGVIDE